MRQFDEYDEAKPGVGEAGEPEEPPSQPFYDPLLTPWEEPAPAEPPLEASAALEPEEMPGFWADSSLQPQAVAGQESPARALPVPSYPVYDEAELSDLRRRLRDETIVVPRQPRARGVMLREVLETLLLAALIFLAVRASFQNFRVEGASMMPNLRDGEYLIVNKLAYAEIDMGVFDWLPFYDSGEAPVHHLWGAPGRGDVVVFRSPTNLQRDFIKRIIGVPGDTVAIDPDRGTVKVNGEGVDESAYAQGKTTCGQQCEWTVPEGSYFVMGDNRQNSSDSRQGWFVPEENIIGKALITYWKDGSPDLELAPNRSLSLSGEAAAEE